MRVSVNKDDPGYANSYKKVAVILDGKKITHCITVDSDTGYILRYKTDEEGSPILNNSRTECLKEELYGEVEILEIKS